MFIDITNDNMQIYYNLSQHYEAEFSPLKGSLPNKDGIYKISTNIDENHKGFILYEDFTPIGFAVIDISKEIFDVCEFYIIPSHRNKKFGKKLAFFIFDKYTGDWEVKQIKGAEQATKFWIKVINSYTEGKYTENEYIDNKWGRVVRQVFNSNKISNNTL